MDLKTLNSSFKSLKSCKNYRHQLCRVVVFDRLNFSRLISTKLVKVNGGNREGKRDWNVQTFIRVWTQPIINNSQQFRSKHSIMFALFHLSLSLLHAKKSDFSQLSSMTITKKSFFSYDTHTQSAHALDSLQNPAEKKKHRWKDWWSHNCIRKSKKRAEWKQTNRRKWVVGQRKNLLTHRDCARLIHHRRVVVGGLVAIDR